MQPSQLRSGGGLRGWWLRAGRSQAKRTTKIHKLVSLSWVLSVFVLFGVLAVCGAVLLWCVWVSGPSRALPRASWPPACVLVPGPFSLLPAVWGLALVRLRCWGLLLVSSRLKSFQRPGVHFFSQ